MFTRELLALDNLPSTDRCVGAPSCGVVHSFHSPPFGSSALRKALIVFIEAFCKHLEQVRLAAY